MDEYINTAELASIKGCSTRYIRKMISQGQLRSESIEGSHLIPVSSLELSLQRKYYISKYGKIPEEHKAQLEPQKSAEPIEPQHLEDFSADERSAIEQWINIFEQWQQRRNENCCSYAESDRNFIAEYNRSSEIKLTTGTLYRKWSHYQKGNLSGLVDNRGKWRI